MSMENMTMNEVAWMVIKGYCYGVSVIAILGGLFMEWKNMEELSIFGILVFCLIFGALLVGKFCFPI